jgi:hypothetical protein
MISVKLAAHLRVMLRLRMNAATYTPCYLHSTICLHGEYRDNLHISNMPAEPVVVYIISHFF